MNQIMKDITQINRCAAQYRTEALAPYGLKGCHASYLLEICAEPGISQDRLSRRICINKSNVARQAAALEESGFILRRTAPEDKRATALYPTEKTLALLPEIRRVLAHCEARLTAGMTPDEQALLARILAGIKARASALLEEENIG